MQTLESKLLQLHLSGATPSTGQRRETGVSALLQRGVVAQKFISEFITESSARHPQSGALAFGA